MKKVFAILLAAVLVMALSVTAFAAGVSPEGVSYYKVHIIDGNGSKTQVEKVPVGEDISLEADPDKGDFDDWKIYKADGTEAVAGVDYKILGVATLASTEMEIVPLNTIVIAANYDNVVTETIIVNDEDEAPETGDSTVAVLGAVALIALCGTVVAKKQLAK